MLTTFRKIRYMCTACIGMTAVSFYFITYSHFQLTIETDILHQMWERERNGTNVSMNFRWCDCIALGDFVWIFSTINILLFVVVVFLPHFHYSHLTIMYNETTNNKQTANNHNNSHITPMYNSDKSKCGLIWVRLEVVLHGVVYSVLFAYCGWFLSGWQS